MEVGHEESFTAEVAEERRGEDRGSHNPRRKKVANARRRKERRDNELWVGAHNERAAVGVGKKFWAAAEQFATEGTEDTEGRAGKKSLGEWRVCWRGTLTGATG